jgi:cytochrome c-type biogenesis protein CcmE
MMEKERVSPVKRRKVKFILIIVVATLLIAYLVYAGIRDTMVYYLTVSQLIEQGVQSSNEGVRVGGKVHEGSVSWNPKALSLRFIMGDDKTTLTVVYKGVVPDSFKQGRKVIVEGIYTDGIFRAHQIMPTCPSKYE